HYNSTQCDKSDSKPLLIFGDGRMECLQERHGCISAADNRSDSCREQYQSEETISELTGSLEERVCCRVGRIMCRSCRSRSFNNSSQDRQEKEYTHDRCDTDSHDGALGDLSQVLFLCDPCVYQSVSAC